MGHLSISRAAGLGRVVRVTCASRRVLSRAGKPKNRNGVWTNDTLRVPSDRIVEIANEKANGRPDRVASVKGFHEVEI